MKVALENGNQGICLMLKAETKDEDKVLHLLDGVAATVVNVGDGMTMYMTSNPLFLKQPEPQAAPPVGD